MKLWRQWWTMSTERTMESNSACRTCLDEVVESEIHKDALRIHVNNKIWKSNKRKPSKTNALSPTGALYRWTWAEWYGNYTIGAEDKKGSKGNAMFRSLLGRENLGNNQWGRKDTLQDRLLFGCWRMLKWIILERKCDLCFVKRHKITLDWHLDETAWNRLSKWNLHASQISSFPS